VLNKKHMLAAIVPTLLAFQLAPLAPSHAPAARAAPCTMRVLTVGDVKVRFGEALGKNMGIDPRFCQIPQATQSFANDLITSETCAMVTKNYRYTRLFALGLVTLCDIFLEAGCSPETAKATRSSLCAAFEVEEDKVNKDAAALLALVEGKSETEILAIDDLQEISKQSPTYSYIFGAGLTTLFKGAKPDMKGEDIERWCDELDLNCKNALTRDYNYYVQAVEKFGQMKEMFAQMDASAKRQAAERLKDKAAAAAKEADDAEADAATEQKAAPVAVKEEPAAKDSADEGGFKLPEIKNPFDRS